MNLILETLDAVTGFIGAVVLGAFVGSLMGQMVITIKRKIILTKIKKALSKQGENIKRIQEICERNKKKDDDEEDGPAI